jgi:hypothetical protein
MLWVNEGDVIDDEHARLPDRHEILCDAIWTDLSIAATIERPGAAE